MEYRALNKYLQPLEDVFAEEGVNEISINQPKEIWKEKQGNITKHRVEALSLVHLKGLAQLIAQSTEQVINEEHPLLSATLPNGYRVQVVHPPACDPKTVAMSIRKPSPLKMTLEDYKKGGMFDNVKLEDAIDDEMIMLQNLIKEHNVYEFLRKSVLLKKNIIISGGTSTGKTTFTNALLRTIPSDERLITAEDAREIELSDHENSVHLLASKGGQGRSKVSIQDLIEACLRLRPDRIIVGELRGAEAFSFLRAINTGHPGSISTLHADNPKMALEQLKLMVLQAGLGITQEQVMDYIIHVVDAIVQLKREKGGRRFVSEILFTHELRNK
ncbi:MAG: P-type DNA transfer ATPase VirB11 [Candidatus Xenolissoclinum pacificiensis L6]|uniref:Type IV secretion system protein n=1 Tax=Candidatus Xenolissoclinum pacificiensis L6 TaxID=1401685 RepID=W2V1F3_9RICK|nr:MAG: P-type DNA transfer ATPase VirB11 [Candidatus Xenolissoclinum pacificiensis L6]